MVRSKRFRNDRLFFVIVLSVCMIIVGGMLWVRDVMKERSIVDFETCAKYYPVMTSYPEQCVTKSGKRFVNTGG